MLWTIILFSPLWEALVQRRPASGFQSDVPMPISNMRCSFTVPVHEGVDVDSQGGGECIAAYCGLHQTFPDGSISQLVPEIKRGNVFGESCDVCTHVCTTWWADTWQMQAVYFFRMAGKSAYM